MMIINCGILHVVCDRKYHDGAESEAMFVQAGLVLEYVEQDGEKYDNQ